MVPILTVMVSWLAIADDGHRNFRTRLDLCDGAGQVAAVFDVFAIGLEDCITLLQPGF